MIRMHSGSRFVAPVLALSLVSVPGITRAGPAAAGPSPEEPAAPDEPAAEEGTEPQEPPEPEPPTERQRAAELFREGTKNYELGQYPEALEKFEAAYELAPEPALLFNMGQAQWRWFRVDPDIEHLRKARVMFENYDKRMSGREGYFPGETQAFITAIDAQIDAEERRLAEANRTIIQGPTIEELEELERRRLRREQKLRQAKTFNASGITFIVLGSLAAGVAAGGGIARATYKFVLDESSGSGDPDRPNPVTADEDRRRRNGFQSAGIAAFSGIVLTAVFLPVGIGLKVSGGLIERRELGSAERDQKRKRELEKQSPSVAPENVTPTAKVIRTPRTEVHAEPGALLTVRF
jgi:tetratricopeptide (TPR) repeat protein